MIDFDFVSPTKIYFGRNKEKEVGQILSSFNYKNILIVAGSKSIFASGLYDSVIQSLNENNIKYSLLKGITPNPEISFVLEGLKIAHENNIDCLLAVGGGSVIDVAKSIAASFYYDGDPYDFNRYRSEPKKALPVGVILTLAASGSELSSSCVISNPLLHLKLGFNSDLIRPRFAILNPELTFSVSKYQTSCGIVDIISHSLERYFAIGEEEEFADDLALAIIKNTIKAGLRCLENPTDYNARAIMMLSGSYSHNGLTGLGKKTALTVHSLEHALSAYDSSIAHGAGLAILLPAWMEYVYCYDVRKFAYFSKEIFNINYEDDLESAKIGVQSLKDYFKKIGMPTSLKEVGIRKEDIPPISERLTNHGTRLVGPLSIKPLNKEDIENIFLSVL